MRKMLLTICAVGLAAAMLTGGCKRSGEESNSGPQGPSATGPTAMTFLKDNDLLGKPVLIEFGIVGCELSDEGYGMMVTQHSAKMIEGLQYVRVEASTKADVVEKYYKDNPADFLVVRDPKGELADAFGATIFPLFLMIDKFGNTRYMGAFPDEVGDWTKIMLAEKSDPGPDTPRLGVKEVDVQALLASTKLPELEGDELALEEYIAQGGLMLVFADANCQYSNQALSELPGVASTLKKAALIRTVVVNITDSEDTVRAYYGKMKLNLPVAYDEGSAVRMSWDIQSVPTIVLVGPQGQLIYRGSAVWADMGAAGEAALDLRPGALKFGARGTQYG
ncbi:MAG: redoxin domain-containing protein [Phycisphaerales bacterium]|jgi:thioredoxin-related protein|nr:redoxin domain-containing protein [Phycisphaerales bacterium]